MIFEYFPQVRTLIGLNAIERLGSEVKKLGIRHPLCIYGYSTKAAGIAAKVEYSLRKSDILFYSYSKMPSDPTTHDIDTLLSEVNTVPIDCVIGIGGGSNMDAAKAVSIMIGKAGAANDYFTMPPNHYSAEVPVVLVPTTAGSGSEASNVCVITNEQLGCKVPTFVEATLAIIDPALAITLPARTTAYSGIDAFSHAIEALLSRRCNPRVEVMSLAAIEKIMYSLPVACSDGANLTARTELAYASNWAGFASCDAPPHVGHGIVDGFGQTAALPHGLMCAWATAEILKFLAPYVPDKMQKICKAMGLSLNSSDPPSTFGNMAASAFRFLTKKLGIYTPQQLGLSREKLLSNAQAVLPLSRDCPVEVTSEVARILLEGAYNG